MAATLRPYIALGACLAGLLLMATIPLATDVIDWHFFNDAYLIFADGFEQGNTSAWSSTLDGQKATLSFPAGSDDAEAALAGISGFWRCRVPARFLVPGMPGDLEGTECRVELSEDLVTVSFTVPPGFDTDLVVTRRR